jgi:hypothetical protein
MGKKNVKHIHNGVSFSHKEEWNYVFCKKVDETGDHHVEWGKPNLEEKFGLPHILTHILTHMHNLGLNNNNSNYNHNMKRF